MIWQRVDAAVAQIRSDLLGLAPRGAVDDTALTAARGDEIGDLLTIAGLRLHGEPQVRPVEAEHEYDRCRSEKLLLNVRACRGVGGRGQRHRLHAAERRLHRAERGVFGAEIVAPLRDAMRL